jgi:hypothetical protein
MEVAHPVIDIQIEGTEVNDHNTSDNEGEFDYREDETQSMKDFHR